MEKDLFRPLVLKLQHTSESHRGHVKTHVPEAAPRALGQGLG